MNIANKLHHIDVIHTLASIRSSGGHNSDTFTKAADISFSSHAPYSKNKKKSPSHNIYDLAWRTFMNPISNSTGEMIVSSQKYHVQETAVSLYETRMKVTVRKFQKEDIGSYRCIAKNSLGEVDSSIRLYGEL